MANTATAAELRVKRMADKPKGLGGMVKQFVMEALLGGTGGKKLRKGQKRRKKAMREALGENK